VVGGRREGDELRLVSHDSQEPEGNATERSRARQSQLGALRTSARPRPQSAENGASRKSRQCPVVPDRTAQRGSPCFRANSSRNSSAGVVRPAFTSWRP
jgi:hypothetical protein